MVNTNPRFVSPLGVAVYPYLHKPDVKFNKDGEYKTTLRIKKDDAQETITRIDEAISASVNQIKKGNGSKSVKTANPPYKIDENGDYLINFKLKAKVTNSKTGTVNHTLLTHDACTRMEIPINGFIINEISKDGYSLENLTKQIEQLTSKSVLATINKIEDFSFEKYFVEFEKNTSLSKLGLENL